MLQKLVGGNGDAQTRKKLKFKADGISMMQNDGTTHKLPVAVTRVDTLGQKTPRSDEVDQEQSDMPDGSQPADGGKSGAYVEDRDILAPEDNAVPAPRVFASKKAMRNYYRSQAANRRRGERRAAKREAASEALALSAEAPTADPDDTFDQEFDDDSDQPIQHDPSASHHQDDAPARSQSPATPISRSQSLGSRYREQLLSANSAFRKGQAIIDAIAEDMNVRDNTVSSPRHQGLPYSSAYKIDVPAQKDARPQQDRRTKSSERRYRQKLSKASNAMRSVQAMLESMATDDDEEALLLSAAQGHQDPALKPKKTFDAFTEAKRRTTSASRPQQSEEEEHAASTLDTANDTSGSTQHAHSPPSSERDPQSNQRGVGRSKRKRSDADVGRDMEKKRTEQEAIIYTVVESTALESDFVLVSFVMLLRTSSLHADPSQSSTWVPESPLRIRIGRPLTFTTGGPPSSQ